jgi:hypothetical protein
MTDDWCYEDESPEFIWIAYSNMNWLPWLRFSWIAMPYPNSAESPMKGTSSTPIQLNRWRLPWWGLPQWIQLNRGWKNVSWLTRLKFSWIGEDSHNEFSWIADGRNTYWLTRLKFSWICEDSSHSWDITRLPQLILLLPTRYTPR